VCCPFIVSFVAPWLYPFGLVLRDTLRMILRLSQAIYEGWMTEGPASTWSSLTDSVLVIIM
jgi:hypothetical protein